MTDPPNMDRSMVEVAKTRPRKLVAAHSDATLISRARLGDASAYGTLYERHVAAARRLARQIADHQADADDIVAESFTRVLSAIRSGSGPAEAFRPYLLTALRRVAFDHIHRQRKQIPTADAQLPDSGDPFVDPVIAELDRSLIARAFTSLPERWSAVLWHTEIEQAKPAEVAALLGISANSVAALSYRAREGLRQAYLQLHLSGRTQASCQPVAGKLGTYVRGRLSRPQAREVESHLRQCTECAAACSDLAAINDALRGTLGPAILGAAAGGYLAQAGPAAGHLSSWLAGARGVIGRLTSLILHRPGVGITALAAAASVAVPAFTLVHAPHEHRGPPPALGIARGVARHSASGSSGPAPESAPRPSPSAIPTAGSGPASPSPGKSPSRSSGPSPTGPASPVSSPAPSPAPRTTVRLSARLSVGIQLSGVLNLGVTALATVSVSDPGAGATGPLTADITLPTGISLLGLSSASSWSCGTGSSSVTCTHPAIGAGAAAGFSFNVLVVSLSGCGSSVVATVTSGSLTATGSSPEQVACGLLDALT